MERCVIHSHALYRRLSYRQHKNVVGRAGFEPAHDLIENQVT